MICTTRYIQIAIQMAFNKQIFMLIYVNQNNGENELLKNKLKYYKYKYTYKTLKKN